MTVNVLKIIEVYKFIKHFCQNCQDKNASLIIASQKNHVDKEARFNKEKIQNLETITSPLRSEYMYKYINTPTHKIQMNLLCNEISKNTRALLAAQQDIQMRIQEEIKDKKIQNETRLK